MADTPRRRSQEKAAPIVSSPNHYCCRCGTAYSRRKGYFPVSHSPMYRGSGYLPFCNECVEDMYEGYIRELGDGKEAMRRICMKMDLYWSETIYGMVERSAGTNSRVRNYIGKTNIVRYIDKTFDDTIKEEAAANAGREETAAASNRDSENGDEQDTDDMPTEQSIIDFWGGGFSHDFYMELERRYKDWTGGMDNLKPAERSLYKQICMQEAIIWRNAANGDPIDKNVTLLNTLLGSMNLKPAQKKDDADAELDKMPLGVGIQKWEYSRPLPETPKSQRDIRSTMKDGQT